MPSFVAPFGFPFGGVLNTEPVVSNFSPDPNDPLLVNIINSTPLMFDVTDDSGFFRRILVEVIFPGVVSELIHTGDGFTGLYIAGSTKASISGGFHFSCRRTGGWPYSPTIGVFAVDGSGLENNNGVEVSNPGNLAPVVDNFSPATGTTVSQFGTVGFDVTDDSGIFRRLLVTAEQYGVQEVVHDGESFRAPYLNSTRTPIAGGYQFVVRRDSGGWVTDPNIVAYPIDQQGLEGVTNAGWII